MPYNQSIDPKRDPSNNTCTTKNLDVWLHELKTEFEQYKQQQSLTNQSNLDKITNLEQENKSLKIRIDQLEKTDKTTPRAPPAPLSNPPQRTFSSLLKAKQTTSEILLITKAAQEQQALQNKAHNIVIRGVSLPLSETDSDTTKVKDILTAVELTLEEITDTKIVRRKHRQANKPPHIIVTFKNIESQQKAVRNARKLRETTSFEGIFINKDLTDRELKFDKLLRTERDRRNNLLLHTELTNGKSFKYGFTTGNSPTKYYYGIRSGNIFRINYITKELFGLPINVTSTSEPSTNTAPPSNQSSSGTPSPESDLSSAAAPTPTA